MGNNQGWQSDHQARQEYHLPVQSIVQGRSDGSRMVKLRVGGAGQVWVGGAGQVRVGGAGQVRVGGAGQVRLGGAGQVRVGGAGQVRVGVQVK